MNALRDQGNRSGPPSRTGRSSILPTDATVWAIGAVLILLLVTLLSGLQSDSVPASAFAARPAADSGVVGTPRPLVTPLAGNKTLTTTVLFNQTVFVGNSSNVSSNQGGFPSSLAYDSTNGSVWVTAGSLVGAISPATNLGIAWVPVGTDSAAAAYDPSTGEVFVANSASANVSVVNASLYRVVATVPAGSGPAGIGYDSTNQDVYVANGQSNNVTVIDASTNRVVANVGVGTAPDAVAYDSVTQTVFIANGGSDSLTMIAGGSNTVSGTFALETGAAPNALLFDPVTNRLYSANGNGNLDVVDVANNTFASYAVGTDLSGLALDSSTGVLYVSDLSGQAVEALQLSTLTVEATISLGLGATPSSVVFDPTTGHVFASNPSPVGALNITVISATSNTAVGRVAAFNGPYPVVYDSNSNLAYVYDGGSGMITGINVTTGAVAIAGFIGYSRVPGQVNASGLAYDSATQTLVVSTAFAYGTSNVVYEVSPTTLAVMRSIVVGQNPAGIAYDPGKNLIYVANSGTDNVSVIDGTSGAVTASIAVGSAPTGVVYDSNNGGIYVTNLNSANVSVINDTSNKVVATASVGHGPLGIAVATPHHNVYVTNSASNSISIISDRTNQSIGNLTPNADVVPQGIAYNSADDSILVTETPLTSGPGRVQLIAASDDATVGTVPVGAGPIGIAYDPNQNDAIVTNYLGGSVSVVGVFTPPPPPAFQVAFTITPRNITLGSVTKLNATPMNRSGPYLFSWSGLPAGCTGAPPDLGQYRCTPTVTGNFTINVTVTANLTAQAHASAVLGVYKPGTLPVLSVNLTLVPSQIILGNSAQIYANASGGTGDYGYNYTSLPTPCLSENLSRFSCAPQNVGHYTIMVTVIDLGTVNATFPGNTTTATSRLVVDPTNSSNGGGNSKPSNTTLTQWIIVGVVVAAIVAIAVALILRRGRKGGQQPPPSGPPAKPAGPPQAWEPPKQT